jgi:diaminopimelate decarboxylase
VVATAASVPGVTVAVRLADGPDSRFGVDPVELAAVSAAGAGRVRALHVHGGPLATAPSTVVARARRACEAAAAAGLELEQLDLGGSLHGFALDRPTSGQATLGEVLAAARAAVPAGVRLVFEPGRLWSEGAGFACGQVLAARTLGGRAARVLDLSRLCHLRWSTPRLVAPPPRPGASVDVTLLGATCCEDDLVGDVRIPPEHLASLDVGARVVLAGVGGYAAGWNRGFAGVPAAQVVTVTGAV